MEPHQLVYERIVKIRGIIFVKYGKKQVVVIFELLILNNFTENQE